MSYKYILAVEEPSSTLAPSPAALTPEHSSVSVVPLPQDIVEEEEAAAAKPTTQTRSTSTSEALQSLVDEKEKQPASGAAEPTTPAGGRGFLQVMGAAKHALKLNSAPRVGQKTKSASGSASESRNTSVSSAKARKFSYGYAGKQNSKDSVTFELSSCHISKFDESSVQSVSVFQREPNRKCSTGTLRSTPGVDKSRRSDSNASAATTNAAERYSFSSGSAIHRVNGQAAAGGGSSSRQSIRGGPPDDRIEEERASDQNDGGRDDAEMQRAAARVRLKSRCRPLWWKFFGWLSSILLFFAGVGLTLGTLVPRRPIGGTSERGALDLEAVEFNYSWDLLRSTGAIFLVVGLLSVAGIFTKSLSQSLYSICTQQY